jgi:DNA-binding PadR family transcriptional regulator
MSERRASRPTRNDPQTLILASLAEGPRHGYALQKDIAAYAGVQLGPGTLYGAIARLEERGLIEPAGEPGRQRPYRLTDSGAELLARTLDDLQQVVEVGRARLQARVGLAPLGGPA